ncbi:Transcriptional regulator, GntR family [Nostocoides japonicum T1-X7]|uniref:Transcriptional regulator, GntR family n=1 Tax=Nostocoides japonicum T1-X7 TaxID=1194083 RepID=A0A077LUD2_9MICO|nr:GntR family transcriptional regulator [Tetrasphaera japonica]CCH77408.1 Transcriptional regulator, GntR family [Tetrasphaera japonica T1-X7]CCH79455.1 Transcriptional regulator, GntR family [Tetrasphaera japonica T1-X7]
MSLAQPEVVDPALPLAERAYLTLRDRLITLQIRPGEPIDDVKVAGELQVGRTPVREALKRLEDDRLVVAYPRRGTFATVVDITDLASINDIRAQLEPLAARRAAERATSAQRAELQDLVDRFGSPETLPTDPTELMRLDVAVHRAIYRASGNPHLEDVLVRYHNLATRMFCLFLERLPDVPEHINEHVPLIEAILAGDADEAAARALRHVTGFEAGVRAVI